MPDALRQVHSAHAHIQCAPMAALEDIAVPLHIMRKAVCWQCRKSVHVLAPHEDKARGTVVYLTRCCSADPAFVLRRPSPDHA